MKLELFTVLILFVLKTINTKRVYREIPNSFLILQ